jgi:phenylacetate-CoA ligase
MAQGLSDYRSREETRQLQMEQLQMTLNRAYFNVDFYRRLMDALHVLPEDVATHDDLGNFPFTTRQDLAEQYPYGLFAEPLKSIVRLKISNPAWLDQHRPIVIGFTRHDVAMWQALMVRLYRRLGVTERDIVQVAFNFSLFPGAFTFNHAAESLGATLAPSATISATLQLQIMQDFHSTVLATTAAFALHLAETMERQSLEASSMFLRLILLGPDPLAEDTRQRLESAFKVPVYGLYGVSEMVEPGVAGECPAKEGLHLAEDQFLAEIVHPTSGEAVSIGHEGELVLTTLTTEGYPLIRYRTGDITVLREAPCPCGRTSARLAPILRRTDNRISIRGIPFYPEQVELMLWGIDPLLDDFRLVVYTNHGIGEQLEIYLLRSSNQDLPGGSRAQLLELVRSHIRRVLGLGARVYMVDAEHLPREGLIYKTAFRSAAPFNHHRPPVLNEE